MADDWSCTENPKEFAKTLLELINEFSQVAEDKITIQNSTVFLYTSNEQSENEIKETISSTPKRINA